MFEQSQVLTQVWAGLIVFVVYAYVVMDGFDLGVGLLFALESDRGDRDLMMNSLAPVWDGNETWLILGGGGLFAAFPLAYAVLMTALYPLVIAMLLGLIFRGVAFEYRWRTDRARWVWDWAFIGGSFVAAMSQGMILGAIVQGVEVAGRAYGGGWWDWATPFTFLTGAAVVCGYLLLGTTWLVMKTDEALQERMRRLAWIFGLATVGFIGAVSLATLFVADNYYMEHWFGGWRLAFAVLVPVGVGGIALLMFRSLTLHHHEYRPFVLSLTLFALCFFGLSVSLYPNIVPPSLTMFETASPAKSQIFMLVGVAITMPMIIAYTAYAYWIFRGKIDPEHNYH